jgi:hypothetical protein
MAKAYQTNSMPVFEGVSPGLNEYGQISNIAMVPRVVAKLVSYTVKASESGTIFTNVGATVAVTYTLPAIGDGPFYFKFIAGANYDIVVTAETADTMVTFNDLTADSVSFAQANEILGGTIEVWCDGTTLFALPRLAKELQTIVIVTA